MESREDPFLTEHGNTIIGVKPEGKKWRGWAMPKPGQPFITLKTGARVPEFVTPDTFDTWWAARAAVVDFVDE